MADTKLTALTELTAPALGDWLYAVDVSDTTDDAAGSSRKILNSSLLQYMPHGLSEISVTGATTATIGRMHVCSGTTADYTLTLPAASGNTGKIIVVRMATGLTKLVTIDGNASETIDGSLTRVMWAGESAILLCDGSNWFKIGGKSIPMMAHLTRETDQTGITADTWTAATMTAKSFGTDFLWDSGNGRLKFARPSQYQITAFAYCSSVSGLLGAYILASKNDPAPASPHSQYQQSTAISSNAAGTYTAIINCVVGDYVVTSAYFISGVTNKFLGAAGPTLSAMEIVNW